MKKIGYVVFVEDKYYLLWQLELFLHSLTQRAGIDPSQIVVLWADPSQHNPDIPWASSPYLNSIFSEYPTTRFHCVQNWGRRNWYFRFEGDGSWAPRQYAGINKWLSLCESANAHWLDDFDEILLLEQDLWFSGAFPILPPGNCVTDNWLCDRHEALAVKDKSPEENTDGFDLDDIMYICKVPAKNMQLWTKGAIVFKFKLKDLKRTDLLNAFVNYNQLLMTLGELCLPGGSRHETDMIAPSLAMAHCGIVSHTVNDKRWNSEVWIGDQDIPEGSVIHYGWDFNNYSHLNASFNKFIHSESGPWTNKSLKKEYKKLKFDWLRDFYDDIFLLGKKKIDRTCNREVAAPVV